MTTGTSRASTCDPLAFVLGPTGLAHDDERDILYVASTEDNDIFAVRGASERCSDAGMGEAIVHEETVNKYLHGPLGLVRAANGDLISSQGDAENPNSAAFSEIVALTAEGRFVAQIQVDPNSGGRRQRADARRSDAAVSAILLPASPPPKSQAVTMGS
jgi:hypothetical protein